MYPRYLLKTNHFGWIFDIWLPFSRRAHRVRIAKMSLYIQNLSQNYSFRRFQAAARQLPLTLTQHKSTASVPFRERSSAFYWWNGLPSATLSVCTNHLRHFIIRKSPTRLDDRRFPYIWFLLSQVKRSVQHSNSIFAICNSTLLLLHSESFLANISA